jgi:hypothetical protein
VCHDALTQRWTRSLDKELIDEPLCGVVTGDKKTSIVVVQGVVHVQVHVEVNVN